MSNTSTKICNDHTEQLPEGSNKLLSLTVSTSCCAMVVFPAVCGKNLYKYAWTFKKEKRKKLTKNMQLYFVPQQSPRMEAFGGKCMNRASVERRDLCILQVGHEPACRDSGQIRASFRRGGTAGHTTHASPDRSCEIHPISIVASGLTGLAAFPICSPLNVRMLK